MLCIRVLNINCDTIELYSNKTKIDESNIEKCTNGIMNGSIRIRYEDTNEDNLSKEFSYRVSYVRFRVSNYNSTNNEFSIIIENPNINLNL